MNRKRWLSAVLAGTMTLSLAACGGGANGAGGKGKDSGNSLTVAIWDNNQLPGLKEIMDDFTAISGVSVEVQVVPWDQYWTLLEANCRAGNFSIIFGSQDKLIKLQKC